jgi:hypothetical protein
MICHEGIKSKVQFKWNELNFDTFSEDLLYTVCHILKLLQCHTDMECNVHENKMFKFFAFCWL